MLHKSNDLKWISSNGGPLVLLPKQVSSFWMGCYFSNTEGVLTNEYEATDEQLAILQLENVKTDYDRACEVINYLSLIHVHGQTGIVIADEPCPTAWYPENLGGILVRLRYTNEIKNIPNILLTLPNHIWEKESFCFNLQEEILTLFDSAQHGKNVVDSIEIKLPLGDYEVFTANYSPDNQNALILHRLTKIC